jgi:neutral ceramidase
VSLRAGVAVRDISPRKPLFLAGYPHVARTSTGVHDPLLASALYLCDGTTSLLLIGVDILFVTAQSTEFCRAAIYRATGVPPANILISATHTHSGPLTNAVLAWKEDPVVPPPDRDYLEEFHGGIIAAGIAAHAAAEPARLAVASATAEGVGCNRLDPAGPFDSQVGLLAVQRARDGRLMALDLTYGMHPTVLHEDSRLVSSDFFHFTRQHIGEAFAGLVTVCHLGPCGNLSPRYHAKEQTLAEAERLGRRLGESIVRSLWLLASADFHEDVVLASRQRKVELIARPFPPVGEAQAALRQARQRYEELKRTNAPYATVRTAECVVFGCEESLTLARAQASGEVAQWQEQYRSAEVQAFRIGDLFLAALPGELFVEYGLEIKSRAPGRTFVISLANGELQGYIVTPEASVSGGYEAQMSFFTVAAGDALVSAALKLIRDMRYDSGD